MQAVSNDACHEVDGEVHQRAMSGVLDLAQVLELIEDRLDQCALAQQGAVKVRMNDVLHVLAHPRDDVDALVLHLLRKLLANVALVGVQLAKQVRGDGQQSLAVIDIARRDPDGQEFALVVDHRVQLEAVEPPGGGFAALGNALENLVALG